jgi:hypothetical protein
MDADRAAELARISAALIKAVEDAQALAARGEFGADLVELLRRARDLHDLALEALAAEHDLPAQARQLAEAIGNKLAAVEAELADQRPSDTLH